MEIANKKYYIVAIICLAVGLTGGYKSRDIVDGYRQHRLTKMILQQLENEPNNADNWILMGNAYSREGDSKNAIGSFRKAMELNPANVLAYKSLAFHYWGIGRLKEAESYFEKAIVIAGKHQPAEVAETKLMLKSLRNQMSNEPNKAN